MADKRKTPTKQLITVRLQNELIDELKILAQLRGIRYQTLIREALAAEAKRFWRTQR